VELSITVRY